MAEPVYRSLLRAIRVAFRGDDRLLFAAHQKIRQGFEENASLSPLDPATLKALDYARDIALILRQNVVQGLSQGDDIYKLNIHEEIERGDNDTVKNPKKDACCGGGCSSS